MSTISDLTGKVFTRLTVKGKTENRNNSGSVIWDCLCSCGNQVFASSASLNNGNTRSCGCLKRENFTNRKHGLSSHPLYEIWTMILQRCYNPSNPSYPDYGQRGISVCDEWRHDFQSFYDWSIASGYQMLSGKAKLTIDRRDNEKGYSPENCRWTTYSVQNFNRRPTGKDMTGQSFGRLTVIRKSDKRDKADRFLWECRCICGNTVNLRAESLRGGNTKSCGCLRFRATTLPS